MRGFGGSQHSHISEDGGGDKNSSFTHGTKTASQQLYRFLGVYDEADGCYIAVLKYGFDEYCSLNSFRP